ncbi:MAG: hypothetical protein SFU56_01205 [Capsulimonadales bacterium]|nr:hypothetical protein [Capsulimonadales bacterium]
MPWEPVVVAEGRIVRDACPLALAQGVRVGVSVPRARRLCPLVRVVPLESLNPQALTVSFLDLLSDLAPIVEPVGPDAAYVELLPGDSAGRLRTVLCAWARDRFGSDPLLGFGRSKLAARAAAECGLPPSRLAEADVRWLWPEDEKLVARLQRLGLPTFGSVAVLPESTLVREFGKVGRLLHRRAHGIDLDRVRPLYPPPRADVRLSRQDSPIDSLPRLQAALDRVAARAAGQLAGMNRHGRRLVLRLFTEKGEVRRERLLPLPIREETAVRQAVRSLLSQMRLTAPVIGIRLIVDETELPAAQTLTLFPERTHEQEIVMKTLRHVLQAKFGAEALRRLSEIPLSRRDERRTLIREALPFR